MKNCPACNRTYTDETLTFCLEDGSVLSAPYDDAAAAAADKTLEISAPRDTDSVLTKISYRKADLPAAPDQPLMPTMLSPQARATYSEKAPYQTVVESPTNKPWIAVAAALVCVAAAFIAAALVWVSSGEKTPTNSNIARNQNVGGQRNLNKLPQIEEERDTIFGPIDDHASLNGENLTYYPGTSPERCQADCAKNERCRGFTFIRAGAYNPNDSAMCYLASAVTGSVYHACCISGVKR